MSQKDKRELELKELKRRVRELEKDSMRRLAVCNLLEAEYWNHCVACGQQVSTNRKNLASVNYENVDCLTGHLKDCTSFLDYFPERAKKIEEIF